MGRGEETGRVRRLLRAAAMNWILENSLGFHLPSSEAERPGMGKGLACSGGFQPGEALWLRAKQLTNHVQNGTGPGGYGRSQSRASVHG